MPKKKITIKEREMKIFYPEWREDQPFPELLSYKNLVVKPDELADINETEGVKLTGIEAGADNLANHNSDELAQGATNKYLLDLSVTEAKIYAGAVTELKIAAQAVTNAKIAVNAIQGDVIAAGAITETKVASDAISTPKLQAGAITAVKIGAGAVIAEKIYALAVTSEKIAAGAVTSDKVTTGELITLAAQIKNAIIQDAHITGIITVGKTAAKCTNPLADQTSVNIAAGISGQGALATLSLVELAQLGTTVIIGGYIKTSLLTADNIQTGTLTGRTVQTASSGKRVVISGSTNDIKFYDIYGNNAGTIYGTYQSGRAVVFYSGEAYFENYVAMANGAGITGTLEMYGPIKLLTTSSPPSSAVNGWMFYHTTYHEVWIFRNGAWKALAYVP